MMIRTNIFHSFCWMAALIAAAATLPQQVISNERFSSPCPDLFHYVNVDQPGQWTGNLLLLSNDDLHGVWIRVIFDKPYQGIVVDGDYEVVLKDNNAALIKNKDLLLKAGSKTNVKISVKYDGNEFPRLTGYRLNARTICPEHSGNPADFFQGDVESKDLLKTILSANIPIINQETYKCGIRSSLDSYPWHADVLIKHGDGQKYTCEATLISPSHLVTAAHCVTFKSSNTEVPVNHVAIDLSGDKGTKKSVARIHVHPAYDPNTLFNDIAVLQLATKLSVNDYIRPICLNDQTLESRGSLIGYSIEENGELGNQLTETYTKKIDAEECEQKALELRNILSEDSYCVSYLSDNSPCVGDSGSSLISLKNDVATLKGIVRVGVQLQDVNECDEDSIVLVTGADKHLRWILSVIN